MNGNLPSLNKISWPAQGLIYPKDFCLLSKLYQPPTELVPGLLPWDKRGRDVMFTTHLHRTPRLRMTYTPSTHFHIADMDNFTVYILICM